MYKIVKQVQNVHGVVSATDNLTQRHSREAREELDLDWFEGVYDDIRGSQEVLDEVEQWMKDMERSLYRQESQYKIWISSVKDGIRNREEL